MSSILYNVQTTNLAPISGKITQSGMGSSAVVPVGSVVPLRDRMLTELYDMPVSIFSGHSNSFIDELNQQSLTLESDINNTIFGAGGVVERTTVVEAASATTNLRIDEVEGSYVSKDGAGVLWGLEVNDTTGVIGGISLGALSDSVDVRSFFRVDADLFTVSNSSGGLVTDGNGQVLPVFTIDTVANKIGFNGTVEFSSIENEGTTIINGGKIDTNFIDVDVLAAEFIAGDYLSIGARIGYRMLGNYNTGTTPDHTIVEQIFAGGSEPIVRGDSYYNLDDGHFYGATTVSPFNWVSTTGADGANGVTREAYPLYKVSPINSIPASPLDVTWTAGVVSVSSNGWEAAIPDVTLIDTSIQAIWRSTRLTEDSPSQDRDWVSGANWTNPVTLTAADGEDGAPGDTISRYTIYKSDTSTPTVPAVGEGSYTNDQTRTPPVGWLNDIPVVPDGSRLYSSDRLVFDKDDNTGGFVSGNTWTTVRQISSEDGVFLLMESSTTVIVTSDSNIPRDPLEYDITMTAESSGLTGDYTFTLSNASNVVITTQVSSSDTFTFDHSNIAFESVATVTVTRGNKTSTKKITKVTEGTPGSAGGMMRVYKNSTSAPVTPANNPGDAFYGVNDPANVPPTGWTLTPSSPPLNQNTYFSDRAVYLQGEDGYFAPGGLWLLPQKLSAKDGTNGSNGTNAGRTHTEYVYRVATSQPAKPTNGGNLSYSSNGNFSAYNGWTEDPPSGIDPDETLWVSKVVVSASTYPIGGTPIYSIASISTPVKFSGLDAKVLSLSPGTLTMTETSFGSDVYQPASTVLEVANQNVLGTDYKWEYKTGVGDWTVLSGVTNDNITITKAYTGLSAGNTTTYRISRNNEPLEAGQLPTYAYCDVTLNAKAAQGDDGRRAVGVFAWVSASSVTVSNLYSHGIASPGSNYPAFTAATDNLIGSLGDTLRVGDVVEYSDDGVGTYRRIIQTIAGTTSPSKVQEDSSSSLVVLGPQVKLYVHGNAIVTGTLTVESLVGNTLSGKSVIVDGSKSTVTKSVSTTTLSKIGLTIDVDTTTQTAGVYVSDGGVSFDNIGVLTDDLSYGHYDYNSLIGFQAESSKVTGFKSISAASNGFHSSNDNIGMSITSSASNSLQISHSVAAAAIQISDSHTTSNCINAYASSGSRSTSHDDAVISAVVNRSGTYGYSTNGLIHADDGYKCTTGGYEATSGDISTGNGDIVTEDGFIGVLSSPSLGLSIQGCSSSSPATYITHPGDNTSTSAYARSDKAGIRLHMTTGAASSESSTSAYAIGTNGRIFAHGGFFPFTGGHSGQTNDSIEPGDIVCDSYIISKEGISNATSQVVRSSHANDKRVVGVTENSTLESGYIEFNALGEGQVHVCELNGNFEQGDLITSSTMPGKGMKQDDDIVRNYTVGKIRESIDWSDDTDEEILVKDGIKYKLAACIYMCG